ncbi:hypothetical protein OAU50_06430 [Planctomycetota bacterium]|nr:hypothetical protein [Planctomycetota bacterium]
MSEPSEICIINNIGPKGARLRLITGVVGLVIAATLWSYLTFGLTDASLWLRLTPFVPLYVGVLGVLQAKRKT